MPAKASRKTAKTAATSGERRPRPGPLGQVRRLAARVAYQRDHRERADRHERVRRQVEQDRRDAVRVVAMTPARMNPACAIEEYASSRLMSVWVIATIAPPSMVMIATPHMTGRQSQRMPGSDHVQQPQQRAERRDLRRRRHEAGDRGGGALVDVRGPHVERHRADLEQQPHQDHRAADQQQRVVAHGAGERRVDVLHRAVDDVGDRARTRRSPRSRTAARCRRAGTRRRTRRAGST